MSRSRARGFEFEEVERVVGDEEGAEMELVVDGDEEEEGNGVVDEGGIVAPVQDVAAQNQEDDFVYERGRRGHRKRGLHGATVERQPRQSLVGTYIYIRSLLTPC